MNNLPRIPTGLIGAIVMIVIAELGVFRGFGETTPFIPASWRESGNAARREAVGVEVLGFGDSQVKCGLQPGKLGRSTFNLAVVGGQAASSYYLLERALEAGARPKAVVVDFFPSLLASDCRINTRQWAEMLDLDACLDLLWTSKDGRLLGPMLAQWLLPSLRMRSDLRAVVVARLLDEPEPKSEEGRAYRRNWRVNLGAHVLAGNPGFVDGIEPGGPRGDRWRPKAEHLVYVRRFLALAEAHRISVFWLMPTTAPGARAVRVRDGREGAYVRFVRSMMAEYPGLTVIDPSRVLAGRAGSFHDVFHLDRRGAVALSEAVGAVIDRSLSLSGGRGPERERWVELEEGEGGDRGAIASKDLEDVGQSAEWVRLRVVR